MIVPTHIWSLALSVLNLVSHVALSDYSFKSRLSDYRDHACARECEEDGAPLVCEYDFNIEYYYTLTQACYGCPYNTTDCFRPHCVATDGVSRGVMTVNRMLPGPAIRVCEGDTIVVNVKNMLEGGEGTAIHWHGILQSKTPYMDGVAMLTQCPISQHSKFQYRFIAETPGTHFWHAHAGLQRADGVFGSLVIRQPKSRDYHSALYDYDLPEHSILLNDWIGEMGAPRFAGHHHAMTEHLPDSILINGRATLRTFPPQSSEGAHNGHGGHMMPMESNGHQMTGHMMHGSNGNQHATHMMHGSNGNQHASHMMPDTNGHQMTQEGHGNGHTPNTDNENSMDSLPTTNPAMQNMHSMHSMHTMEMQNAHVDHGMGMDAMPMSTVDHNMHNMNSMGMTNGESNMNMNNGDSEMPSGMESLTTLSNSDLEMLVNSEHQMHQMHQMAMRRRRSANENTVTVPTTSDDSDKPQSPMPVQTPRAIFTVKQGQRYRFRVASNGVNNCPIEFSIDNHTLTVISSDGTPFKPVHVQSFNIFAGERYDFILNADKEAGNFWIRTRGLADCGPEYNSVRQTAILRYEGVMPMFPKESTDYEAGERPGMKLNPFNKNSDLNTMNVDRLESLIPDDISLKVKPDRVFYLGMDFNFIENYRFNDPDFYPLQHMMNKGGHAHHMFSPQINKISYSAPPSPPLTQYTKDMEDSFCDEDSFKEKNCKKEFCECTHRIKIKLGEVVEMVLVDEGKHMDNNHPMHMHGYNFRVVAMEKLGNSTSVEHVRLLDDMGLINRKLHRAISKDTVTVPDGGYTIIRFHATNPGFWLFHCHIAFHMEMGMSMVLQVGEPEQMPKPPPNFPRCGDWTPKEQAQTPEDICPTPPPSANMAVAPPTSAAPPTTTLSSPRPTEAAPSTVPPLHQIYLGGIQQTTDVNLKDVTLHYALLVWMTGKKNPMKSPKTSPLFGDHGRHKNMTGVKSKHHRKNKNLSGGHQKPYQSSKSTPNNLPLMSIKSAKVPSSSKSSMIELTNLPKMIVPAHYIKKIISDQPLSKSIKQGSRRQRGPGSRERTGRLSTSIGSVGRRNITVNAINNHKQTTFRERPRAFPSSVRNAPTVLNTVSSPKLDRYTNDLQKTMPMRKRNHIDRYGKLRNMSASRHRTSHSLSRVKRDLVRRLQSKSSAPS
ncbi:uncharacterized protein LOC125663848 isoform X2 [Ostrea edulis]|nr:uncharacterized protein LOC125663848 isoform X2 [Ostrea edulis]XP_048752209.2 uncharacterized protein LOC125663848 isoform X2 [Ostrea edulis]XP_048752210.2 uncharacterized protein LOC125663848 isoform X2 [Ostrea edulis]XP_048752211.2 uncharacterized protein LOC125663848 isoform X2 [Ostrea edulis]